MRRKYLVSSSVRDIEITSTSARVAPAIASTSSMQASGCCAAVALPSGQALELDGRLQIVIVEQRGNGIVGAGVKRKNKLRHASPGLTPITRQDSEAGRPIKESSRSDRQDMIAKTRALKQSESSKIFFRED